MDNKPVNIVNIGVNTFNSGYRLLKEKEVIAPKDCVILDTDKKNISVIVIGRGCQLVKKEVKPNISIYRQI